MAKKWSWNEQDLKKLSIYVRKFNTAITRLEKNAPDLIGTGVFPERLNVKELKSRILNKRDYNRELAKIDRFFKKGAKDIIIDKDTGYRTTRWQKREEKLIQKRLNEQKKRFIKKYNVPRQIAKDLGLEPVNLSEKKKKIFSEAEKLTDPEDIQNKIQEWYNISYTAEREAGSEYLESNFAKLRNSYFKAIRNNMPEEQANELIQFLEDNEVWGSDIVWAISQNDIFDFEYMYSLDEAVMKAEIMKERWENILPELKQKDFYKNKKEKGRKKKK